MNKLMVRRLTSAKNKVLNTLSVKPMTLTTKDAGILLREFNTLNRSLSRTKVIKYRDMMNEGDWNHTFLEGNVLVFAEDLQILSAQHRLQAFYESDLETWEVALSFVTREFWLTTTQERRSDRDRLTMLMKHMQMDTSHVALLSHVLNQVQFIERDVPVISRSAHFKVQDDSHTIVKKYYPLVTEAVTEVQAVFPSLKAVPTRALVTLLIADAISVEDLPTIKDMVPAIEATLANDPTIPNNHCVWSSYAYKVSLGITGKELLERPDSYERLVLDLH